ncbi:hypothetical protein [Prevotella histicola]|jgi:hypothetical protein|uniref:hypothetical protein n=1 Tax=Prevotella histicola TaxID=470565 RepID=UPI001C5E037F|nr:hypothetical protein [Prevotella histicola]MBS6663198.1 hypothetical protein [Prevotella histicola]MBW4775247.1 hypothetical protein [Prevotella histicola]
MSSSLFLSVLILPNGSNVSYKKYVDISNLTQYLISISNHSTERINSNPPEDFDFIMSWLGNVLYPMTVCMDDSGEAKGIENIEEVRERYATEGQKIIDYYEQDALVTKYVKGCIKKVQDEKEVLQCISQGNIYQLATLYMAITAREYRLVDFPFIGDVIRFSLSIEDEDEDEILLSIPEIKTERKILSHVGKAYVHKTEKGTFDHIQLMLEVEIEDEGYYTRKLELKQINEEEWKTNM